MRLSFLSLSAAPLLTVLSVSIAFDSWLSADDWPEFLGPTRNGISQETGLLDRWPESGPPLVWEKEIGTGYSAPSIRDGLLVVHHRQGNEEIVEAFDVTSKQTRWRHAYPSRFVDPFGYNNGPRCSPLLTENRCYTFGAEGRLVCLDIKTGKLIWNRETQKDFNIPQAYFGVGSTPILEGGLLIVMVGGQPNSGMVAFDAATGKTVWESVGEDNWTGLPKLGFRGEANVVWKDYAQQASYATPVAATVYGKRHIFCLMRQGLVSLDPSNGAVRFSRWFRAEHNESVNAANPVVVDDRVFVSAAYYGVGSVLLEVLPDGNQFKEIWSTNARRQRPGGRRLDPVLEIHWTTPIFHEGYLYAFSGRNEPDAHFRCVEMETGKIMWDRDERWQRSFRPPQVYGRGSAILADGKLIVLGEAGLLGLFRVNPKKPEELGRYQVPQMAYPCWAAPILSEKHVYLRSEDRLLCFDFSS